MVHNLIPVHPIHSKQMLADLFAIQWHALAYTAHVIPRYSKMADQAWIVEV